MAAKELMRADVCWFAGEESFELGLEAYWPVLDEEEKNKADIHWEPTKFRIPDLNKYCKVSAAEYVSRNIADAGNTNANVTVAEDEVASSHITSGSATDTSILDFDLSDTNTEISDMDPDEIIITEDLDSDDAGDCMVEGFVLTWT